MNNLKFRAWHKKNKRWYETELKFYGSHIFGECTLLCPPLVEDLQHLEITQWTGLVDKHGVDVYESDYIEADLIFKGKPLITAGIVEYDKTFGAFGYRNEAGFTLFHNLYLSSIVVKGNIFQSEDLLTEEQT